MLSKTSITLLLLAIVLVTSTDAVFCEYFSSQNVGRDQLVGPLWYIESTDDTSYAGLGCFIFVFYRSSSRKVNNLIVTTYRVIDGKFSYPDVNVMAMEYKAPSQYSLWNTGDFLFDPSKPGDVKEIGMATFTQFVTVDGDSAFVFKTCIENDDGVVTHQYLAYSGVINDRGGGDVGHNRLLGTVKSLNITLCDVNVV